MAQICAIFARNEEGDLVRGEVNMREALVIIPTEFGVVIVAGEIRNDTEREVISKFVFTESQCRHSIN